MLGVTLKEKVTNKLIREETRVEDLTTCYERSGNRLTK